MSHKPKKVEFPSDHPMRQAGFMHELDVMEFFGVSNWGTWERRYRMKIAGMTFQSQSGKSRGRIYHRDDVLAFYHSHKTQHGNRADR